MARLGKRERQARRVLFTEFRAFKQAVVETNLKAMRQGKLVETSKGYGVPTYESRMTHGLYRGLYDPMFSSVRDTGRGLK